jgi:hypothetical protein
MGERKFILTALFAQDTEGVFDWLIEEAALWQKRHRLCAERLGAIARVWEDRAQAASSLLKELRRSAATERDSSSIKHS